MHHNTEGWFKWFRKSQFHELYMEKPFDRWHAWEHLVINANHTPNIYYGRLINPGQLPVGERDLAYEFGWSRTAVRTFLRTLVRTGMITTERTSKGTIVTIVNWAKYQGKQTTDKTTNRTKGSTTTTTTNSTTDRTLYKNIRSKEERIEESAERIDLWGDVREEDIIQ